MRMLPAAISVTESVLWTLLFTFPATHCTEA